MRLDPESVALHTVHEWPAIGICTSPDCCHCLQLNRCILNAGNRLHRRVVAQILTTFPHRVGFNLVLNPPQPVPSLRPEEKREGRGGLREASSAKDVEIYEGLSNTVSSICCILCFFFVCIPHQDSLITPKVLTDGTAASLTVMRPPSTLQIRTQENRPNPTSQNLLFTYYVTDLLLIYIPISPFHDSSPLPPAVSPLLLHEWACLVGLPFDLSKGWGVFPCKPEPGN